MTYMLDRAVRKLRPGITVCVAAHPIRLRNGLLMEAIASITQQTLQPEAILVVNDKERHGAGRTRQHLLAGVQTEWIAWLDSDDLWKPEHLATLWTETADPDVVYVYSWFEGNDPLGHFGKVFDPCRPHHTTITTLVKTEIAQRVGFEESAVDWPVSNEDLHFIFGCAKIACDEGLKIIHVPTKTWTYRQQGQNSSGLPHQGDAKLG